jgi:kinesin family protein 5
LRQILRDLDTSKDSGQAVDLSSQAREAIRAHLVENQDFVGDLQERLRASEEEGELQARRRGEVERMLVRRDDAYEELLGESF